MSDIAAIAAGLNNKQRMIVLNTDHIGGGDPKASIIQLCEVGLADCTIFGDDEAER